MIQVSQYQALSLQFNGLDCIEQKLLIEETKKAVCTVREVSFGYLLGFVIITARPS
jgi:hypothetical protein